MKTHTLMRSIMLSLIATHLLFSQYSQQGNSRRRHGSDRFAPVVSLRTWQRPVPGDTTSTVTVFMLTMNDILQFIKTDSGYTADYEISLSIRDDRNNLIDTRVLTRKKRVRSYDLTNAKDVFQRESETFILSPGIYTLQVSLDDRAASTPLKIEKEINVNGRIPEAIHLSDPLFFHAGKTRPEAFIPDSLAIEPVVSQKHRHLYFNSELYTSGQNREIQVIFSIYDSRSTLVRRQTKKLSLQSERHPLITGIPEGLPFGQYRMALTVTSGSVADSVIGGFSVLWSEHASARPDVITSVHLMQYLLSKRKFKELLQLDREKQEQFLDRYWLENDPDPVTEKNELEEEFYQRAAFAIAQFTTPGHEGWETDRGKIYILYGPPEHIERPVSRNGFEKYELWDYPRIQKKFLFVDQNGTGNFILQSETG